MTLLPLAGWSANITIQLSNTLTKQWGEADPTTLENTYFSVLTDGGSGATEDDILSLLTFKRLQGNESEEIGNYQWTVDIAGQYEKGSEKYSIVASNTGLLTIQPKDIEDLAFTFGDLTSFVYDATPKTTTVAVKYTPEVASLGEQNLTESDFEVEYDKNINAGTNTAKIIVKGKGHYTGKKEQTFSIAQKEISTLTIGAIADQTYTGSAIEPALTVTSGSFTLAATDYTATLANNTNVSPEDDPATISITIGGGNFKWTGAAGAAELNSTFNIVPLDLAEATGLTFSSLSGTYVYRGTAYQPQRKITSLTLHTDYEWEFSNNINAGTGTITYTGKGNYKGTLTWNFTITPLDLEATTANSKTVTWTYPTIAAKPYAGAKITETEASTAGNVKVSIDTYITDKVLVGGEKPEEGSNVAGTQDFYLTYGENLNQGTNAGTVTLNGVGNFKGTKVINFDISKADLYITPDDEQGKTLNSGADPELTWHIEGLVGTDAALSEAEQKALLTGTPTLSRTGSEDAGEYLISVDASGVTAENYNVKAYDSSANPVYFTVAHAIAAITVNALDAIAYGDAFPTLSTSSVTVTGLVAGQTLSSVDFEVIAEDKSVVSDFTRVPAGTYTIKAKNPVVSGAQNYTFEYTDATLTINKRLLTIEAKTQEVAYPAGNITNSTADKYVVVKSGDHQYNKAEFNTTFGIAEYKSYFIGSLTWENEEGQTEKSLAHPGFIKVNLTDTYDTDNFDITPVPANVTWSGVETGIEIVRLDINEYEGATTVADKLKEYDGVPADVTLKAKTAESIEAFRVMKANRWYSLVLPFNTSVREISKAFGYAVVDVFSNSSTDTDVNFSLWLGAIDANEPFLLKIDSDRDLFANPVTFSGVTIAYEEEPAAVNNLEDKFIGAYDGKKGFEGHEYVFSLGTGNISGTSATTYIPAMAAYIQMANQMDGMNNARVINIEEPDGSMTSVNSIGIEGVASGEGWYNLNGVKLQGVPSTKGVYIQNGKKTVIK